MPFSHPGQPHSQTHSQPHSQTQSGPQGGWAQDSTTAIPLPHYMTRQPMLDGEFRLLGHELGIRDRGPVPVLPGATSARQNRDELLLVNILDMDYRQALGHKITLLNLTPETLDNPLLDSLPRQSTVLALETLPPSPALLARGQALARDGFALALDEATLTPDMAPLARESRYLRLDVGDHDLSALCDRLVRVQGIRGPRLIARDVETEEAFNACRKLSFDLYQGYFFTQLRPAHGRTLDPGRVRIMELLNLVSQRADFPEIEARFKLDPALTYRILRYINSPAVGLRYPIQSIGHVLLMLGHNPLYRWLTLLLFAQESGDRRNLALLRNTLVRARLAETLGEARMGREAGGGLFVCGILSSMDSLLGLPLEQALGPLKLAPSILEALLHQRGPYAPWLALAQACEDPDPTALVRRAQALELDAPTVNQAHLGALAWAEGMDL